MGKHQPQEISSKFPISTFRQVIEVEKKRPQDPRFDRNFGHYNSDLFSKSYSFLQDIQGKETQELEAQLVKEKDPKIKAKLKLILGKRRNQQRSNEQSQKTKKIIRDFQKADLEKVSAGVKKPFFLKKSAQNQIIKEFHNKKDSDKPVEQSRKTLEKKLKRRASKQKKRLPWEN